MDFFFWGALCDADARRRVIGRALPAAQIEVRRLGVAEAARLAAFGRAGLLHPQGGGDGSA
jgi:hypothetical protein